MNLSEVRDYINELSDTDPDSRDYKNFVDTTINKALQEIWLMKPWTFTFKETELHLHPDITGEDTDIDIDAVNMSRRLLSNVIIRELGDDFYRDTWQGQAIELEGREYPILKTLTSSTISVMWMAEPYRSEAGTSLSNSTDWTIKHRYYRLPEDCVKLVSFVHADKPIPGGSLQSAQLESIIRQDTCPYQDRTGDYAQYIFKAPDLVIPPAGKIRINTFNSANTDAVPEGTWVEFAWSYMFAGEYGPLSESTGVVEIPDTAGNYSTIVIDCLDQFGNLLATPTRNDPLDKPYPIRGEGLKKVLWYNINIDQDNGVRAGLPCWKMVSSFDPAENQLEYRPVTADDNDYNLGVTYYGQIQNSESHGLIVGQQVPQIERRYIPHKTQQIQPWPRVNAYDKNYIYDEVTTGYDAPSDRFKVAIIRYICKPYPLALDTDESPLPPEFTNLLVYKVLENIFMKNHQPDRANFYAMKFDRELPALERRYLQIQSHSINRDSWGNRGNYSIFDGHGPGSVSVAA